MLSILKLEVIMFLENLVSKYPVIRAFLLFPLKGLSSENDIEGYFIEKSVLISKLWLKIS